METIGSKRSYALIWCMPNNDDDDVNSVLQYIISNEDISCIYTILNNLDVALPFSALIL